MKPRLLIIMLFIFASYYAQSKKDTTLTGKRDSLVAQKPYSEKKDTSLLKLKEFLWANHIILTATDVTYFVNLPKATFNEEIAKSQKSTFQQAQENLKNIMKRVNTVTEDKRSWLQKFFEDFLDIAEKVAVVALALKVILK